MDMTTRLPALEGALLAIVHVILAVSLFELR
jgi:hypothetical protein